MSKTNAIFGWDLMIRSVQSDIATNHDVILCYTHLVLISNGFKCVGLGESKTLDGDETQSEALPPGWQSSYALRYLHQGRLYLLKATRLPDALLVSMVRVDERTSAAVQFNTSLVARLTPGSLDEMLPRHSDMMEQIKTELIGKLTKSKNTQDGASQTTQTQSQTTSSHGREPYGHGPAFFVPPMPPLGPTPAGVGEFDLNPFGRNPLRVPQPMGGGGMLFEPPRGGRYPQGPEFGLPPGAVPPGARFDPFRPPDADPPTRRLPHRPDNDELPPPGYDDMFM